MHCYILQQYQRCGPICHHQGLLQSPIHWLLRGLLRHTLLRQVLAREFDQKTNFIKLSEIKILKMVN